MADCFGQCLGECIVRCFAVLCAELCAFCCIECCCRKSDHNNDGQVFESDQGHFKCEQQENIDTVGQTGVIGIEPKK